MVHEGLTHSAVSQWDGPKPEIGFGPITEAQGQEEERAEDTREIKKKKIQL